jgi:hypothetical protein
MGSVADELRRSLLDETLKLSFDERLALTARLAEADIDLYCAAHHASREDAKRVFIRQRRTGRRPSCVMQEAGD